MAGWQFGSIKFPVSIFSYKETLSDFFHKLLHARVCHLDEMAKVRSMPFPVHGGDAGHIPGVATAGDLHKPASDAR
jgi:hypothetical protein